MCSRFVFNFDLTFSKRLLKVLMLSLPVLLKGKIVLCRVFRFGLFDSLFLGLAASFSFVDFSSLSCVSAFNSYLWLSPKTIFKSSLL